mgnify:CR=1 FL=1
MIPSGNEEDAHYLTKGDNNRVHDQQLYQKSKGNSSIVNCRPTLHPSRLHLRP